MSMVKTKLKQLEVEVIKENDGSISIGCSALGVYTVGKTLSEAKKNFSEALDLHLETIRENTLKIIAKKSLSL